MKCSSQNGLTVFLTTLVACFWTGSSSSTKQYGSAHPATKIEHCQSRFQWVVSDKLIQLERDFKLASVRARSPVRMGHVVWFQGIPLKFKVHQLQATWSNCATDLVHSTSDQIVCLFALADFSSGIQVKINWIGLPNTTTGRGTMDTDYACKLGTKKWVLEKHMQYILSHTR